MRDDANIPNASQRSALRVAHGLPLPLFLVRAKTADADLFKAIIAIGRTTASDIFRQMLFSLAVPLAAE
jgi:hypothetical protein